MTFACLVRTEGSFEQGVTQGSFEQGVTLEQGATLDQGLTQVKLEHTIGCVLPHAI